MMDKKIYIISPAKTGTGSFLKSCEIVYPTVHSHNLDFLKDVLECKDKIIITGIRDPIARNLSYFFQTKNDNYYNDFKTSKNNYQGELCYIKDCPKDYNDLIKVFFEKVNMLSYNEWLEEFLQVTGIESFNKEKGYEKYILKNNNCLLLYTLEKLHNNKHEIFNEIGISNEIKTNVNSSDEYLQVKKKIKYEPDFVRPLLFTKELEFFYTKEQLQSFFDKYIWRHSKKNLIKNTVNQKTRQIRWRKYQN